MRRELRGPGIPQLGVHIRTVFRLWDEGRIAPKVSRTWPLEQGAEAIAHMAARQAVGKLVVTMDD